MKEEAQKKVKIHLVVIVCAVAFLFMAAGMVLFFWSSREMRNIVVDQFNEEQLVIARSVSSTIERELSDLKREIVSLKRELSEDRLNIVDKDRLIQSVFPRVIENGVGKILLVDFPGDKALVYSPHAPAYVQPESELPWSDFLDGLSRNDDRVWVSPSYIRNTSITMFLGAQVVADSKALIVFEINVSWFATPLIKDIRSGKTGYAWLIDETGHFLYHPQADFIGESAFAARQKKYPDIPFSIINFIQKENMLKGQEGTGSYFSGWHRGITGKIEKLIAYTPVNISDDPPRKWSVAIAAPVAEVDGRMQAANARQFLIQGLVIGVIVLSALAILFLEWRWSRVLQDRVDQRTRELKRSEEKYRSLVESAEDFIYTVDAEGSFKSINNFTANFFGGRPEDFMGKPLSDLLPKSVASRQLKQVSKVFALGKSVRDEFNLVVGGNPIWLSANLMPIKDEKGAVNTVLCIARDITDIKNLERQLVNAEKLASIGTLAAGVAHEINNPLGVILGFCDLLIRKADPDGQVHADLKIIERQGLHCKEVVENLLSFARVGEEVSEYSDVNDCIEQVIKIFRHTLEMRNIELKADLEENIPAAKGDSRQLQQVFFNLVNNAVAAMEGGGVLGIRTELERGTRKAVIRVQDTGVGISEKNMEHIYDPFFTTKPEGAGTGLGLFISYGIVSKFGGSISCVSQTADVPGRESGTTFTVKLLTRRLEE